MYHIVAALDKAADHALWLMRGGLKHTDMRSGFTRVGFTRRTRSHQPPENKEKFDA